MHNEYSGDLEITLVGPSPNLRVGGGPWIEGLLKIFSNAGFKINLVSYIPYSNKFKIEHKNVDSQLRSTTMTLPSGWPRFLKAVLILLFNFVYTLKSPKTSRLIYASASTTMLMFMPVIAASKLCHKLIVLDYLDRESHRVPDVVCKYFMKKATIVFAISHYLVDKAKSYGCKNVVYFPAFVDTNLFQINTKSREKIREKWGIGKDGIVIGYAGALSHSEGIPVLLQALKALSSRYANIRLLILGAKLPPNQGPDVLKLVKGLSLEGSVTIIPPVPHAEVPNFLSVCDILCSPKIDCEANRVANPIKVIEYLSMGIPTVSSSIGEVTRFIEHKVTGFLTRPGDAKDLENVLEEIILNPEQARQIGSNGRMEVIKQYSSEVLGEKVVQALREAVILRNQ